VVRVRAARAGVDVGPSSPAQEGTRTLELRVDNYNRRPIRITGLRVQRPAKVGLVAYHLAGHQDVLLGDMNRRHNEVLASLIVEGTPPAAPNFNSARLKLVLSGPPLGMHRKSPCMLAIRVDYELLQDAPEKHSCTVSLELCASSLHSKRKPSRARESGLVPAE
jgi:hypothetical protein